MMADTQPSPRRKARELAAAQNFRGLQALLKSSPDIIRKDFIWFDELLRAKGRLPAEIRKELWGTVLARSNGHPETLIRLLDCAIQARDAEWAAKLATLAETNVLQWVRHLSQAASEARYVAAPDEGLASIDRLRRPAQSARSIGGEVALDVERGEYAHAHYLVRRLAEFRDRDELDADVFDFANTCAEMWLSHKPINSVEFVVFAHASRKLVQNAHLAPPTTGLLERSIGSIRRRLASGPCPVTVFLDFHGSELDIDYRRQVERFCAREGVRLVVNEAFGLRKQWLSAFTRVEADLIGIVEQDFEFLSPAPTVAEVVSTLDSRPDVNYVRINKRTNDRSHFDKALVETSADRNLSICRTARFSNTPHFIRRSFANSVIQPMVGRDRHDTFNSGAGGVEENVNRILRRVERHLGLPATITLLGNAIYGPVGHPAACEHLGV